MKNIFCCHPIKGMIEIPMIGFNYRVGNSIYKCLDVKNGFILGKRVF